MYVSGHALLPLTEHLGFQTCHFEAATVITLCNTALRLDPDELMQIAPREAYRRSSVLQSPSGGWPLKYIILLVITIYFTL